MISRASAVSVLLAGTAALATRWAMVKRRGRSRAAELSKARRESRLLVRRKLEQVLPVEFLAFDDVPVYDEIIGHVVVGPTGVHAIESRPCFHEDAGVDRGQHAVRFDGRRLYFDPAGGGDPCDVDSTRRKARSLKEWIGVAAREYVKVQPVLVLTGCRIETEGLALTGQQDAVRVMNETGLGALVEGRRVLQPSVVHRIASRLGQHCRVDTLHPGRLREQGAGEVLKSLQNL